MKNIKKISMALFGTILMFGGTVFAATGTVTTNGLRMRKEASTDSDVVTSLNNGAQVEIVEEVGEWYKVKYYDEYEGYLFSEYVKINGENQEIPETTVQEPENQTSEEEEPEQSVEEAPTQEKPDEEETVQNEEPVAPETAGKVVYPIETTIKIKAKVYILPLITSTSINEIEKDVKVTVQKELNDWVYIYSETISGWVRKYNINIIEGNTIETNQSQEETVVKPEEQTPVEEETETQEPEENEQEETIEEQTATISKGYINVSAARIRKEASTNSDILEVLTLNTEVKIIAETDEWYKIQFNEITGYISKTLISETLTQTSRGNSTRQPETQTEGVDNKAPAVESEEETKPETTPEQAPIVEETPETKIPEQSTKTETEEVKQETDTEGQKIADFAKQYVGYKYVYGGTKPSTGFDCSGFVYYVYNSCGHSLSRLCSVQARSGRAVTKANLQEGDLVFFNNTSDGSIGHVGIYIGNGNFVHAATSEKGVRIDTINSGYYNTYYYSARRVL